MGMWTVAVAVASFASWTLAEAVLPPVYSRLSTMSLVTPMGTLNLKWVVVDDVPRKHVKWLTLTWPKGTISLTPADLPRSTAGNAPDPIAAAIKPIVDAAPSDQATYAADLRNIIVQALNAKEPAHPILSTSAGVTLYKSTMWGGGNAGSSPQIPTWVFVAGGMAVWAAGIFRIARLGPKKA